MSHINHRRGSPAPQRKSHISRGSENPNLAHRRTCLGMIGHSPDDSKQRMHHRRDKKIGVARAVRRASGQALGVQLRGDLDQVDRQ
jgi:hypothetical protein